MSTDLDYSTAACASYPRLFSSEIFEHNPNGSRPGRTMTAHAQAENAARLAEAERRAKMVCGGCPMLEACRERALETEVYGVAGGLTARERRDIVASRYRQVLDAARIVDDRDRGARNQVNDEAIARLTRAQWTNKQIAEELGCSPRSVARSRARLRRQEETAGITQDQPTTTVQPQVVIEAEQIVAAAAQEITEAATVTAAVVQETPAAPVRLTLAPVAPATISPITRKRVSAAMGAIYAVLADGQWHHRDDLLAAGIPHVEADKALAWYARVNPSDTTTSREQRIARGAREIVANSLTASARNRGRTIRNPQDRDQYRIVQMPEAADRPTATPTLVA